MSRILIAEDEPRIVSFLEKGLQSHGYVTSVASSGAEAMQMVSGAVYDLLILDLGIPGMDGLQLLEGLRGQGENLPVIILSARQDLEDKVAGLEGGANDYVTKPFRFEELLARVRVQLRFYQAQASQANTKATFVIQVGPTQLDLRTRQARKNHKLIDLSAREFALLEVFMRHAGQVLSREQILNHVWGYDFDPGSNVVEVHIRHLRKKLGADCIETVRGMGYRYDRET
ncbi:MAG: response regulator transcription factor [Synechococcaceae cyanobacterium SM2_3_1]|nr:response regulator transcription factor [Synechococcaceae cyanobacterium SM2_3_1]